MSRQSYLSDSPATRHVEITPADTDLETQFRALYAATDGDIEVRDWAGVDITYSVLAGAIIPVSPRQVRTGTTATVIGWY